MRYQEVIPAVFLERPNRFIALVLVNGQTERVHVKNTGRCRELLIAGCTVYLAAGRNPSRKTKYDLIAVEKVLPDSTALLINLPTPRRRNGCTQGHSFLRQLKSGGK